MDKYAIYLRKSRADLEAEKLGEGETLARHKKILTEFAVRKELYVEKIYQEIGSGETIEARPQIQALINDCYAGLYRGIIVIDVDRLSRGNQGDMQVIMDCLRFSNNRGGILVVTPTKTYDVAHNADDEEYMEFVLFMSRREYKTIQKRLLRGKQQAVVEGNYLASHRPYGYDIKKLKRGRTLVPNPDEAPVVKRIFEWVVREGLSPAGVKKRLDAEGVPTYNGDPEWSVKSIKNLLTNPVYAGKVRWNNRVKVKALVNGKLTTTRVRGGDDVKLLYDGKHEALVDEEMYQEAVRRYPRDKTRTDFELKNPFAGLLLCAKCGKMLRYMSDGKRAKYPDRLIHQPYTKCQIKSAKLDDVMDAFVHALKLYVEDFELRLDKLPAPDENSVAERLEAMRTELRKVEKRLAKLFDAWEDGNISDNEFVQRKDVNNKRIEAIKAEIEEVETYIPEREDYEDKVVMLSEAIELLRDPDVSAEAKNECLKKIIEKIEFSRETRDEFVLDVFLR